MNDDLDDLYRRTAERDSSQPSEATRCAIIEHAAALAAARLRESTAARPTPLRLAGLRRHRRLIGGLAAAALAGLLVVPRFFEPRPTTDARAPLAAQNAPAAPQIPPAAPAAMAAKSTQPGLAEASHTEAASQGTRYFSPPTAGAPMEKSLPSAAVASNATAARRSADASEAAQAMALPAAQDMNGRDAQGRTLLLLAILRGDAALVDTLLARGADPNISDRDGLTPLRAALDAHRLAMAEALRRAGAR